MKNLHLLSLGCPKTRVDSELMLGLVEENGWKLCENPEDADAILVNTCAFLRSSIEESIDHILELAEYKKSRCKKLIVAGCLPSRFRGELEDFRNALPEVDALVTCDNIQHILSKLEESLPENRDEDFFLKRRLAQAQSYAYLKISEGCDRRCAFCAIPLIRGKQRSRSIESLVQEARNLAAAGVKELVLVAQELTHYGNDLGLKNGLIQLIDELEKIESIAWIRLMYTYPWNFGELLIERLGKGKVLGYVDIPLQHVSTRLLKSMRRSVTRQEQDKLIKRLREIPDLVLRTSLIAGYPGESEEEFLELCNWVEEIQFDRLGVFAFSPEEGTGAAEMPDQIPPETRQERRDRLMEIQQKIHRKKMQDLIGKEITVLVDGQSIEHPLVTEARYYGQAPEVDGVVYISYENSDVENLEVGQFAKVKVAEISDYDLLGVI